MRMVSGVCCVEMKHEINWNTLVFVELRSRDVFSWILNGLTAFLVVVCPSSLLVYAERALSKHRQIFLKQQRVNLTQIPRAEKCVCIHFWLSALHWVKNSWVFFFPPKQQQICLNIAKVWNLYCMSDFMSCFAWAHSPMQSSSVCCTHTKQNQLSDFLPNLEASSGAGRKCKLWLSV